MTKQKQPKQPCDHCHGPTPARLTTRPNPFCSACMRAAVTALAAAILAPQSARAARATAAWNNRHGLYGSDRQPLDIHQLTPAPPPPERSTPN